MWNLELGEAHAGQPPLDRTSVFHLEYLGLQDLARKSTKRFVEVAFDLMRVDQRGPACKMCRDYYYYLNTGEVNTEPHKSQMYRIVQSANLEHMNSDVRCQNEVRTTRNC